MAQIIAGLLWPIVVGVFAFSAKFLHEKGYKTAARWQYVGLFAYLTSLIAILDSFI